MNAQLDGGEAAEPSYVSTGHLPPADLVRALVDEAHERYRSVAEGKNSEVYPTLARVPSELFGVCVVGTSGNVYAVGDAEHEFSIMSVSKSFVFALVCSPRSTSSPADVGLAQRTKLMPALDIFSSSAFSMVALTDAINKMPYVPGRIGQLGLFREQGVSTTSVMIEEREGSLNLVETTARGAPAIQNTTNKRKARSWVVPHIALEDTILADEVQKRARLRLREHARGRAGGGQPGSGCHPENSRAHRRSRPRCSP